MGFIHLSMQEIVSEYFFVVLMARSAVLMQRISSIASKIYSKPVDH